jgi:hypothetical protein
MPRAVPRLQHVRAMSRRFLRENGLSLALAALFSLCLVGQGLTGHRQFNHEREDHGEPAIGLGAYLRSAHFAEATFENWESEFLQMGFYVLLTVFLLQKGSAESRSLDGEEDVDEDPRLHASDPDAPGPVRRGGLALKLYEHSLSLAFLGLFALSFALHSASSLALHNDTLRSHGEPPVTAGAFLLSAQLWFESFQNWQSEFLAVASIVVLSIFLRERGSPESKPVATPHGEQGDS